MASNPIPESVARVLVCGGRDYSDTDSVAWELSRQSMMCGDIVFVCGYDPDDKRFQGADQLAFEWARRNGFPVAPFPAPWGRRGRGAGPVRNQRMLDCMKPHKVISFPGGRGTADMVRRAKAADVEVFEVLASHQRMEVRCG